MCGDLIIIDHILRIVIISRGRKAYFHEVDSSQIVISHVFKNLKNLSCGDMEIYKFTIV